MCPSCKADSHPTFQLSNIRFNFYIAIFSFIRRKLWLLYNDSLVWLARTFSWSSAPFSKFSKLSNAKFTQFENPILGFNISSFVADVDILNNQKITVIWISLKTKTRRHYSVKKRRKGYLFKKNLKKQLFS